MEGQVFAGKYRLEAKLGEGGMGVVYAARHIRLDQRFAIKVLRLEATQGDNDAFARFEREARAAARVTSDHVARVVDVDTLPDGTPFLVMEHLQGEDLANRIARGPLSPEELATYMLQACEAIAEAHAHGIVHRDLKPSNLFLHVPADGHVSVKVLDFGISKMQQHREIDARLTRTGAILGTPLYMAPEQMAKTSQADARADVWSLGVVAFEALSGRTPFDGGSLTELIASVLQTTPPNLADLAPHVPRDLADVIAGCLEKQVDRRTPDVRAFAQGLARFAPHQAAISIPRIASIASSPGLQATMSSPPGSLPGSLPASSGSFPGVRSAPISSPQLGSASGSMPGAASRPRTVGEYARTLDARPQDAPKGTGPRVFVFAMLASVVVCALVLVGAFVARSRHIDAAPAEATSQVAAANTPPSSTLGATQGAAPSAATTAAATGVVTAAPPATQAPATSEARADAGVATKPTTAPHVRAPTQHKDPSSPLAMPMK